MSTNPFDIPNQAEAIASLAYTNPFDPAGELPGERTWTEAETCEAWGGCEQHPLPATPVQLDESPFPGKGDPETEAAAARMFGESAALPEVVTYDQAGELAGVEHMDAAAESVQLEPINLEHAMRGRANGKTSWLKEVRAAQAAEVAAYAERLDRESVQLEPIAPRAVALAAPGNREDVFKAIAAHEAAAKALRDGLTAEARAEYESNHTRAVYDVPGVGKLVAALERAGVRVADPDAWMRYAATRWPTEVVMVPAWRNPAFEKQALAALAALGEGEQPPEAVVQGRADGVVVDDEGTAVPGLEWAAGGAFKGASLTLDHALKRQVAEMAKQYVAGKAPLEIEGARA